MLINLLALVLAVQSSELSHKQNSLISVAIKKTVQHQIHVKTIMAFCTPAQISKPLNYMSCAMFGRAPS